MIPVLALITAVVLWGSSFSVMKMLSADMPPLFVVFARMFIASCGFLIFWKKVPFVHIRKEDIWLFALMTIAEPCLYFVFEVYAVRYTTSAQAGMITALLPLFVGLAAWIFLKEKLPKLMIVGFVVAILGLMILTFSSSENITAPNPLFGNFLEVMAMICATAYIIPLKKLCARYSPIMLTAMQAFVGTTFFGILLVFFPPKAFIHFNTENIIFLFYLGFCITICAYGLYNYGVSRLSASRATAFTNLIPVFALLIGWLFLDEKLVNLQFYGVGIIFVGVILSQYDYKRRVLNK